MVLVGYWPLNESSGSTAYDHSGDENHGTVNDGGDSTVPGANGMLGQNAYSFDGSNDYVVTDSPSSGDILDRVPSTGMAWVKIFSNSSKDKNNIISSDDPTNYGKGFGIGTSGNIIVEYHNDFWNTGITPAKNEWHHIALTYSSNGEINVFLNGEKWASNTVSYSDSNGVSYLRIGRHNQDVPTYFEGIISEVRIYDHALTPSEIQYLYTASQRGRQVTGKKST